MKYSNSLLVLAALLNFIYGFGYTYILVNPIFAFNANMLHEIGSITLGNVVIYHFGKFASAIIDYFLHSIGFGSILLISIFTTFASLILLNSFLSAAVFLLGFSTVLGSISLRDLLTQYESYDLKKKFNTFSTIGWSLGVITTGILVKYSTSLVYFFALIGFVPTFFLHNKIKPMVVCGHKKLAGQLPSEYQLFRKPIWYILAGSLLYSVTITLVNSSVSSYLISNRLADENSLSLVLGLPILGAILSVTFFNKLIIQTSTVGKYILFKLLTLICVLLLFSIPTVIISFVTLAVLGFSTTEETALSNQMIFEGIPSDKRRTLHAAIDIVSVVGAAAAWVVNKLNNNVLLNLSGLFLITCAFVLVSCFRRRSKIWLSK